MKEQPNDAMFAFFDKQAEEIRESSQAANAMLAALFQEQEKKIIQESSRAANAGLEAMWPKALDAEPSPSDKTKVFSR
jgi:phosphoribosyl-dephospho-CoA transferase